MGGRPVSHMLLEAIAGKFPGRLHHHGVARDLRDKGGGGDGGDRCIALHDRFRRAGKSRRNIAAIDESKVGNNRKRENRPAHGLEARGPDVQSINRRRGQAGNAHRAVIPDEIRKKPSARGTQAFGIRKLVDGKIRRKNHRCRHHGAGKRPASHLIEPRQQASLARGRGKGRPGFRHRVLRQGIGGKGVEARELIGLGFRPQCSRSTRIGKRKFAMAENTAGSLAAALDGEVALLAKLVADEDDAEGLVAFALHRRAFLDWVTAFEAAEQRKPNEGEIRLFLMGETADRRLAAYRERASLMIDAPKIDPAAAPARPMPTKKPPLRTWFWPWGFSSGFVVADPDAPMNWRGLFLRLAMLGAAVVVTALALRIFFVRA